MKWWQINSLTIFALNIFFDSIKYDFVWVYFKDVQNFQNHLADGQASLFLITCGPDLIFDR